MIDDPGLLLGPESADLWKPVIAAVNRMACGGAFYLLGEVEFIVAAESASFFDPHVTYGMTAAFEPILMQQQEGTVRALWAARELGRQGALSMAPALVTLGNQPEAIAEGQSALTSGLRIEPRIR